MRKLITILLILFCGTAFGQVYQLMPQYGYQANRFVFDSTLQIPTTCGVPTLKSVQLTTKRAAIAFDSCNNTFYQYNPKTQSWSAVSGGGGGSTDTTSLSNRINLKIDSLKRSSDSIYAYKQGTAYFQYRDSVGDTASVVIAKVHNATGTLLQRGEIVYLDGATGDVASVLRANNKNHTTSTKTLGIVRRDIAIGGVGYVTTKGQVEKLNLSAYTAGDMLYLDSIDGKMTNVMPSSPLHSIELGVVERANGGNGLMYFTINNKGDLINLHDVSINGVLNNQIIAYSDTQKVWKNRSVYTIVDTTSLSNRINQKLSISDTATMLNNYLASPDTISLSNRINLKYNTSDTNLLQQKSLPANSIVGNATYQTANAQSIYFKDTSGTYSGTITWTGTTAPSGTTNHSYRWTRIGSVVTLNISIVYQTAGSGLTAVVVPIPSDAPTPIEPSGLTAASNPIYASTITTFQTLTGGILGNAPRSFMRNNSGNNGFEILGNFTGSAVIGAVINVQYNAQ